MTEEKLLSSNDVAKKIQNVQIYPATERVEINDKFAKAFFKPVNTVSNKIYRVTEKQFKKGKKAGTKVATRFSVSSDDGEQNFTFSEFDRAVLSVCISEHKAGNLYTTVNIIHRALTGKVGEAADGIYPCVNQIDAITASLKKLIGKIINFYDAGTSLADMGYIDDPKDFQITASAILPAVLLNCRINGQLVNDVVYFDRVSPLLEYAEPKNQIVRYPAALLDVPNQNNTPLIIMLKNYVMRRISEIKLHKQLTPTITFDDVFQKCGIDEKKISRDQKYNLRLAIFQLFEHLKEQNFINSYQQEKRGVSVYAVSFVP